MEGEMRPRVRDDELHGHGEVQRIVPGDEAPLGSVFHSRYEPSRRRGPAARPPSPKNRASVSTSLRCTHRAAEPAPEAASASASASEAAPVPVLASATGSHHRGGRSRRNITPPGVRISTAP